VIWSSSHGPSLVSEWPLAEDGLEAWRLSKTAKYDVKPIFLSVKDDQQVFNGYGTQETCDMLFQALLSPCIPTSAVCEDAQLWIRFKTAVFEYQEIRLALINSTPSILPFVSGRRPFRFNKDGHNRFLTHVSTYRHWYVKVNEDQLKLINEYNLLNPNAIFQNNGKAVGKYALIVLCCVRLILSLPSSQECPYLHSCIYTWRMWTHPFPKLSNFYCRWQQDNQSLFTI